MATACDCFLDVRILDSVFTFIDVPGYQTLWDSPHRVCKGVYLWCIEFQNAFLVSYVGKTSGRGGFERRLLTEFSDWKKGRYCPPVEIDAFLRGERITISSPDVDHRARELAALASATRILLAPLAPDGECRQVESFIVNELRRHPRTFQFLGNADKHHKYNPKPSPIARIVASPPIIGLTAPISD